MFFLKILPGKFLFWKFGKCFQENLFFGKFSEKNFPKKNFPKKIFRKKIFQKKKFSGKNFPKKIFRKKFSKKKFSEKNFPKKNFPKKIFRKKHSKKKFFQREGDPFKKIFSNILSKKKQLCYNPKIQKKILSWFPMKLSKEHFLLIKYVITSSKSKV